MLVDTRPAFIRLPVGIANDRANLDSLIYNLADDFDWRAFELPTPVEELVDAARDGDKPKCLGLEDECANYRLVLLSFRAQLEH